jgi:hypothetical protein
MVVHVRAQGQELVPMGECGVEAWYQRAGRTWSGGVAAVEG